ncbi:MAG TPA: hypothetical protein VFS40_15470 [Gemmatimonadales bacterium]|nr:hypothetical protein [Gemmatimonadales bacterium]
MASLEQTIASLERDPRPIPADEAAQLLGIRGDQLLALDLPVVDHTPEGGDIYDSKDVAHWLLVKHNDGQDFSRRLANFGSRQDLPPH